MQESSDAASALRSENADLQRTIERLGEKMELANEVVLAKATVSAMAFMNHRNTWRGIT